MGEYESVVIPIYEELLVGCLTNIMSDVSNSDLARTYGQLMASRGDVALCLRTYASDESAKFFFFHFSVSCFDAHAVAHMVEWRFRPQVISSR